MYLLLINWKKLYTKLHYCGTRNLTVIECMYLCLRLNSLVTEHS